MIFFMSTEGRKILEFYRTIEEHFHLAQARAFCDTLALRMPAEFAIRALSEERVKQKLRHVAYHLVLDRRPFYKDAPIGFDFSLYDAYGWLTEQFIVQDLSRINLLKLSAIVRTYDLTIIQRLGKKCKALKKFNIPYLSAALDSEGAEFIEEIRKENRLEEMAHKTTRLALGTIRPKNLKARMQELENDRKLSVMQDEQ